MSELHISETIFEILHPHFLAGLSILLSSVYVFKFVCVRQSGKNPIYILRAVLWLMFAAIWAAFPYVDLIVSRSLLRAMIVIIMAVEIAYNIFYVKDAIVGTLKWILHR